MGRFGRMVTGLLVMLIAVSWLTVGPVIAIAAEAFPVAPENPESERLWDDSVANEPVSLSAAPSFRATPHPSSPLVLRAIHPRSCACLQAVHLYRDFVVLLQRFLC